MADRQHWLMKSEPDEFSIDDLARVRVEPWSGVRNFMARFHMRAMHAGDLVLFHHSSVDPPGVAGLARVVRTNVVDEKQFDRESPYFDPKATRERPIWDCVDVEFVAKLPYFVSMDRMRAEPACAGMLVLKRGMRLSVQPVTAQEYAAVVALGNTPPAEAPEPEPRPRPRAKAKPAAKAEPAGKAKARAKAKPRPKAKPQAKAKPAGGPARKRKRRPRR